MLKRLNCVSEELLLTVHENSEHPLYKGVRGGGRILLSLELSFLQR